MSAFSEREALDQLRVLIVNALAIADELHLDAAGIALDTARQAVEHAIMVAGLPRRT